MALYPDEQLYLVGFSYGGAAAIEFAHLLNDFGGTDYKGTYVPGVSVRGLITIDAVASYRSAQRIQIYAGLRDYSVPSNVDYAINLYATDLYRTIYHQENPFSSGFLSGLFPGAFSLALHLNPVDHGMRNINGSLNVAIAGTNHCSIGYASCPIQAQLGSSSHLPSYTSQAAAANPTTLSLIKGFMRDYEGVRSYIR